ncbi:10345_t:CDS:2 [Entrophospora sp. SA101]|nr:10345_t:CDS:2 [Entrophospora sp. SA101]
MCEEFIKWGHSIRISKTCMTNRTASSTSQNDIDVVLVQV